MAGRIFDMAASIIVALILLTTCSQDNRHTYQTVSSAYRTAPQNHGIEAKKPHQPAPGGPAEPSGRIDIQEAVAVAIRSNPEVEMALSRIAQSEAMIDEARAAFWPSLGFYSEYVEGDAPSAYLFKKIDQRELPAGTNFNDPGTFRNFESGATARVNLFKGGRNLLRKKMAEKGLDISRMNLMTVRNDLCSSVIQAYFTALATKDFIQIEKESVDTVGAELKNVQIRYKGGSALKSEVLSLEVRLAKARADVIRAENSYHISLAALANLMGMAADADIQPASDGWKPAELPGDYEAGLLLALSRRPELLKVREQIVSSKMALDLERRAYLPTIDAQAKGYFDDEDLKYDGDRANWTVGVLLNWDIFTGFSRKAKIDKARAMLGEMMGADRKVTQAIQLDVKTAFLRRSESDARLKVAKVSTVQAEEALRLVKKEYEGGSATIVRYLDAQLAQNAARVSETSAYYDLKKAEADLCRALGFFREGGFYDEKGI
jgi:outer membrane protein